MACLAADRSAVKNTGIFLLQSLAAWQTKRCIRHGIQQTPVTIQHRPQAVLVEEE